MVSTLKDAWKIPDLRRKIIFTLAMLFIYRLGSFIPVPFIDTEQLSQLVNDSGILVCLILYPVVTLATLRFLP